MISGGQTGADRAALEAAKALGIQTGGFAPPGFLTSHGKDPSLAAYGLKEVQHKGTDSWRCASPITGSIAAAYVTRTKMNVDLSDATIAFRLHPSVGTDKTIQYCASGTWGKDRPAGVRTAHRPCLVVASLGDDGWAATVGKIQEFVLTNKIIKLNVAGHREAPPDCPDFEHRVKLLLQEALTDFV